MRVLSILYLLTVTPLAIAGELDGHYQATLDGQPAELILHSQGSEVSGEYIENHRLRLNLRGQLDGQTLQAQISNPRTGQLLANMNANYANGLLNVSIAARNPSTGAEALREAMFRRSAAPPEPAPTTTSAPAAEAVTAPANPDQDPALVGTWIYEQMTNSSGAEFASLSSVTTLRIRADGSIEQWQRTVAGSSEWSYDRPGELQYSGRWRTADGLLLVQLQGNREYQPAARYHFSDPFLVTESNTGQMTWQRR